MKTKKKPVRIKHKASGKTARERHELIALVAAAILVALVLLWVFSARPIVNEDKSPKAAIVDQESMTNPDQTFIETVNDTLTNAGYRVDYYPWNSVTVDFYRNLPDKGYRVVILRVHSSCFTGEKGTNETPVCLFTSENYDRYTYVYDQIDNRLLMASYLLAMPPYYFAITPDFVTHNTIGTFKNTLIIMMGCDGLNNTGMAEAFISKGASTYVGWYQIPSIQYDDTATAHFLQSYITSGNTLKKAVEDTMTTCKDPSNPGLSLGYFPTEAGTKTIGESQSKTD